MRRFAGILLFLGALGLSQAASELQLDTLPRIVEPGHSLEIRWTRTGAVPFVKIDYRYVRPSASWVVIADSIPDTGKFVWKVPSTAEGLAKRASSIYTARIRISGPDSVRSDSGELWVAFEGTRLRESPKRPGTFSFSVSGFGPVLTGLPEDARVFVHDLRGRSVASIALSRTASWNRRDARGVEVASGSYTLRAVARGKTFGSARILIP